MGDARNKVLVQQEREGLPYWLLKLLGDEYAMRYLTISKYVITNKPDATIAEDLVAQALTADVGETGDLSWFMLVDPTPWADSLEQLRARWPDYRFEAGYLAMSVTSGETGLSSIDQFFRILDNCAPVPDCLIGSVDRKKDWQLIAWRFRHLHPWWRSSLLGELESFYLRTYTGVVYMARNKKWGPWPNEVQAMIDYTGFGGKPRPGCVGWLS
jgi:hypothetical protein